MPPSVSQAEWEMTLVMPLGVLANQLVKIEGDVRFLSMKAAEQSSEGVVHSTMAVVARLDLIDEVLENIGLLLVRLRADLHPKGPAREATVREAAVALMHKPLPQRDD